MGWHTAYELELATETEIEWEDDDVARAVEHLYSCSVFYVRDETGLVPGRRVIVSIYSGDTIQQVMSVLYGLYPISMKFRRYGTTEWTVRLK